MNNVGIGVDCAVQCFTCGMRRKDLQVNCASTGTLTEQSDPTWIPTELVDVVPNPTESLSLVLQAKVPWQNLVLGGQEACVNGKKIDMISSQTMQTICLFQSSLSLC